MLVSKKKFIHVIISVLWIILFFSINLNRTTAGIFLLAVYAYAIFAWIDVTHKVSSMYFIFLLYVFYIYGATSNSPS